MGVMDWMDGDGDEESDTIATDGLGFDEELDDDMGGLDGGIDDFDGEGDDFDGEFDAEMDDFDGEMEGFDDGGEMGGFDDGGDLGGSGVDADRVAEIEDRLSEMENEVSSISSGMNTVREENKQIGETVEELDDTIRKLLDIYEMVTRGINPFVDDAREMGGLESDGAFGLFDMEEEEEESLDPDVASADAEEFFDEDFGDLEAEEDEAELAAEDELTDADDGGDPAAALDSGDEEGDDEDSDSGGGGASFDELKSQYEEEGGFEDEDDEESAAEDDEAAAEESAEDGIEDALTGEDLDEEFDGDIDEAFAEDIDGADADAEADAVEDETETVVEAESAEEVEPDDSLFETEETDEATNGVAKPAAQTNAAADAAEADAARNGAARNRRGAQQPADTDAYLTALPARYTAESAVLEWARFLVDVGGAIGAARALRQYRTQGWITRQVERTMSEHVRNAATAGETERPEELRVEHHRESLTYISRLAGDVDESRLLEELSTLGGGSRGIRR
jgi:archaellum component FlaD/FlaE/archaellum component FlaC